MYMYTYMNQCDDVRLHQCDDVRVAAHGGHQTQILGQYIYIYMYLDNVRLDRCGDVRVVAHRADQT